MRGDPPPPGAVRRYWKFRWEDLNTLPTMGAIDYQPKGGAFRVFNEGTFAGEHLETFPAVKKKTLLSPAGCCIYCGRDKDAAGKRIELTSEHIIPEFLGAGLELPKASCEKCQKATSDIEEAIAREMFDPVRKSFSLKGKNGVLRKSNFPLDIGRETTDQTFIPLVHFPTILVMPFLYPASDYSNRPIESDDPFNFRLYNINANATTIKHYSLDAFSMQTIDMVKFSQFIAKIAYAYASHHFGHNFFTSSLAKLIRTNYPPGAPARGHFEHVGCLWQQEHSASEHLHEIETGTITWNRQTRKAARVRLFASYGMPSYFVTVEMNRE